MSLGERANIITNVANALMQRCEEFAQLESVNAGKPIKLARNGDIPFSVDNLRFFAGASRRQV